MTDQQATPREPYHVCGNCGADFSKHPVSASAHQCAPAEPAPAGSEPPFVEIQKLVAEWRASAYELGESALRSEGPRATVKTLHSCADVLEAKLVALSAKYRASAAPVRVGEEQPHINQSLQNGQRIALDPPAPFPWMDYELVFVARDGSRHVVPCPEHKGAIVMPRALADAPKGTSLEP